MNGALAERGSGYHLNRDLLRRGRVVPGVGGGVGWVGSGGKVDHGELSGGAHREEQEQRAAPLLCVGRSAQRDRPITYVTPLGAVSWGTPQDRLW